MPQNIETFLLLVALTAVFVDMIRVWGDRLDRDWVDQKDPKEEDE